MVNVEEAQLIVLLPQDEEERIAKFQKFAKVVPPNRVSNLQRKEKKTSVQPLLATSYMA